MEKFNEFNQAFGEAMHRALGATVGEVKGLTKKPKPRKRWWSPPPDHCDLCGILFAPANESENEFVDGRTKMGAWGCMCVACHGSHGVGLGTGLGQKYQREADGIWYKVEG